MAQRLTERQQDILTFIKEYIDQEGFAPTVREIANAFGIRSTNGVADHLKSLERKGYITHEGLKSRTLRLRPSTDGQTDAAVTTTEQDRAPARPLTLVRGGSEPNPPPQAGRKDASPSARRVPVLGRVAAGAPILAEENLDDTLEFDASLLGAGSEFFALRVRGDSMIGDGIFDGDHVFVRRQPDARDGQIVVAQIDGEATVKRLYREGDRLRLQPANPRLAPLYVLRAAARDFAVLGVVVGVYRRLD